MTTNVQSICRGSTGWTSGGSPRAHHGHLSSTSTLDNYFVLTIVKMTGIRRFFGIGTCSNGFLAHLDFGAWGIPGDVSVQYLGMQSVFEPAGTLSLGEFSWRWDLLYSDGGVSLS